VAWRGMLWVYVAEYYLECWLLSVFLSEFFIFVLFSFLWVLFSFEEESKNTRIWSV
jgi:hypothetical protein